MTAFRSASTRQGGDVGVTQPPTVFTHALVATFAWVGDDGLVTALNVRDSAEAVGDFYVERVHALVQAEGGEPPNKPKRHGAPLVAYIRR